jgi:hypothetical protein
MEGQNGLLLPSGADDNDNCKTQHTATLMFYQHHMGCPSLGVVVPAPPGKTTHWRK